MAQAEANGIQQASAGLGPAVMPPPPIHGSAPFGNSVSGSGNRRQNSFQSGISAKMSQPMPMSINQGTSFDITTVGINQPIPSSFDISVDDVDFNSGDFGVDSDDWFIGANEQSLPTSELLSEEDESMFDYEDEDLQPSISDDDVSIYIGDD